MKNIKISEDGTSFDYHFYLKHKSYKNLIQLENEIREIDDEIEKTKQIISYKTFQQYIGYDFGYSKDVG